jgi:hypothetical protein
MPRFQPSFALWPRPQFLGESRDGFAAWILRRHRTPGHTCATAAVASITQMIEDHHDRGARTISAARRPDA